MEIEEAAKLFVELAKTNHLVVYTGAGISTSCGVDDYVTMHKKGFLSAIKGWGVGAPRMDITFPSYAHRALAVLKPETIITSNHDDLHQRLDVENTNVIPIYGAGNDETCLKCGAKFSRRVQVPKLNRKCEQCGEGRLVSGGVPMGGTLDSDVYEACLAAVPEVALVLGSSMSVQPQPSLALRAHTVFVVSLEGTEADHEHNVIPVHGTCDQFMRLVVPSVPPFLYGQPFEWRVTPENRLVVCGARANEPVTCLESVAVNGRHSEPNWRASHETFAVELPPDATEFTAVFRSEFNSEPLTIDLSSGQGVVDWSVVMD